MAQQDLWGFASACWAEFFRFIEGTSPGAVSRAGRKGTTKVFKHRRRSPWVPTLTEPFPNGQANAGSRLGTKMLCIIVPNRRTVSPEFFSWVRTRRHFSRHSCPVHSPSFPNQKWRNYRWVEKRFGSYQQMKFNLHWENSVSDGSQCIVNKRKFKGLFTWTGGPRSSGVGFFCFHALGYTKQKKPTPLDRGSPLLVNRVLDAAATRK